MCMSQFALVARIVARSIARDVRPLPVHRGKNAGVLECSIGVKQRGAHDAYVRRIRQRKKPIQPTYLRARYFHIVVQEQKKIGVRLLCPEVAESREIERTRMREDFEPAFSRSRSR